jgi:hypothetical protein
LLTQGRRLFSGWVSPRALDTGGTLVDRKPQPAEAVVVELGDAQRRDLGRVGKEQVAHRLVPIVGGPQQPAAFQVVDRQKFIECRVPMQNLRQYRRRTGRVQVGLILENLPRAVVYRVLSLAFSVPGTFSGPLDNSSIELLVKGPFD